MNAVQLQIVTSLLGVVPIKAIHAAPTFGSTIPVLAMLDMKLSHPDAQVVINIEEDGLTWEQLISSGPADTQFPWNSWSNFDTIQEEMKEKLTEIGYYSCMDDLENAADLWGQR